MWRPFESVFLADIVNPKQLAYRKVVSSPAPVHCSPLPRVGHENSFSPPFFLEGGVCVFLCDLGCRGTQCGDQAGLRLADPVASARIIKAAMASCSFYP